VVGPTGFHSASTAAQVATGWDGSGKVAIVPGAGALEMRPRAFWQHKDVRSSWCARNLFVDYSLRPGFCGCGFCRHAAVRVSSMVRVPARLHSCVQPLYHSQVCFEDAEVE
jgi:hypothetical protein